MEVNTLIQKNQKYYIMKKKLEKKRYYETLSTIEVEEFIHNTFKTFEDFYEPMIHNISPNVKSLFDLAKILIDVIKTEGYEIQEMDERYFATKIIWEVDGAHSISVKAIVDSKDSPAREFMIGIISHMTNVLYYTNPGQYLEHQYQMSIERYEYDEEYDSKEEQEEMHKQIENDYEELEKFSKIIESRTPLPYLEILFNELTDTDPYDKIMKIVRRINSRPMSFYELPDNNEEVEFLEAIRIEYDWDNFLTDQYIQELDDRVNNIGISSAKEITQLGNELQEVMPFEPYLELINELSNINDGFIKHN